MLFLGAAILLVSCDVPSLQPLYTADTLAFEAALLGTWRASDSETTYEFSDNGAGGYRMLVVGEDGAKATFSVYLTRIGGQLFGDMCPDLEGVDIPEHTYAYGPWDFAPLHNVYLIEQVEPTLRLKQLNGRWFEELLAQDPLAIAHARADTGEGEDNDATIISASTAELRGFYEQYATTTEAFTDFGEFARVGQ
jgi:hypothetical protein